MKLTLTLEKLSIYRTSTHTVLTGLSSEHKIVEVQSFWSVGPSTHTAIQVPTQSIENTTIHMEFNGQQLRISSLYKSPASTLLATDIDRLLDTNVIIILAGDLNAKNPVWNSLVTNTADKTLFTHMENHEYTIVAPESPTHFPDIHHHTPDVLDIAILKITNLQYTIENLNDLSSDYKPIILDISLLNRLHEPAPSNRVIINLNRFFLKLHEPITNSNPTTDSKASLDSVAINVMTKFQEALMATSTVMPNNFYKDLPNDIQSVLITKRHLKRKWQHTRNPEIKRLYNQQTEVVRKNLQDYHNANWHHTLDFLKPNDSRLFNIIAKKPPNHPLLGPSGLSTQQKSGTILL